MLGAIWEAMRPRQWTKNLLVYAGLLFSGRLFAGADFLRASAMAAAFCLASSGVYLVNDIFDVEKDRAHPTKRFRPIAAGRVSRGAAIGAAALLFAAGLSAAYVLVPVCAAFLASYIAINLAYAARLKHVVILDVMAVAYGFVARAVVGALAIHRPMTAWFLLCVMFLSLFLALGKRRQELWRLGDTRAAGRRVLRSYTLALLDQLMTVVTTAVLLSYALFTLDPATARHGAMGLTIPLVLYGIFYYLYLVRVQGVGEAPDEALYRAKPLLFVVLLYAAAIVVIRNLP